MSDPLELEPNHLAVVGKPVAGFPRLPDWHPAAAVRLQAEPVPADGHGLRWAFTAPHPSVNAATAEVRVGSMHAASAAGRKVVLKLQRAEAALNTDRAAIRDRFSREQSALRDLSERLPPGVRGLVPDTLNPDGTPRWAQEALRLRQPVIHCLAASHALRLRDHDGELVAEYATHEEGVHEHLRATIGRDPSACAGCGHYESGRVTRPAGGGNPIPVECRAWVVPHRPGGLAGIVLDPSYALILSHCGESAQARIDQEAAAPALPDLASDISRALEQVHDLARTLKEVHASGWLHLDINFDNICEDADRRWRLIDFGHAEQIRPPTAAVLAARIPLRRVDFAAPEMQMRSVPITATTTQRERWLRLCGHVGWPVSWLPHAGDLLEIPSGANGQSDMASVTNRERGASDREWEFEVDRQLPPPKKKPANLTLHRAAGVAADVYSFGLVLLCRLFQIQKPIDLREELAVFERALHRCSRNASRDEARLTSDNWLRTYKRVYSRTSELIGRYYFECEFRSRSYGAVSKIRLKWLLQKLLSVGLRCVLRYDNWTYVDSSLSPADPDRLPFDVIAGELSAIREEWRSAKVPVPLPDPISVDQFIHRLDTALPRVLPREQWRPLGALCQQAQDRIDAVAVSGHRLREVIDSEYDFRRRIDLLDDGFRDWDRRYDEARTTNSGLRAWLRRVGRSILVWGGSHPDPDPEVLSLGDDLHRYLASFGSERPLAMSDIVPKLNDLAVLRARWMDVLTHPGRRFGERRQLRTTHDKWQVLRSQVEQILQDHPPSDSVRAGELWDCVTSLSQQIRTLVEALTRFQQDFGRRVRDTEGLKTALLQDILMEYRELASIVIDERLKGAGQFHARLTRHQDRVQGVLSNCERLVRSQSIIYAYDCIQEFCASSLTALARVSSLAGCRVEPSVHGCP